MKQPAALNYQRCNGCGKTGLTYHWENNDRDPTAPELFHVPKFYDDGRAALLCATCRAGLTEHYRRLYKQRGHYFT